VAKGSILAALREEFAKNADILQNIDIYIYIYIYVNVHRLDRYH